MFVSQVFPLLNTDGCALSTAVPSTKLIRQVPAGGIRHRPSHARGWELSAPKLLVPSFVGSRRALPDPGHHVSLFLFITASGSIPVSFAIKTLILIFAVRPSVSSPTTTVLMNMADCVAGEHPVVIRTSRSRPSHVHVPRRNVRSMFTRYDLVSRVRSITLCTNSLRASKYFTRPEHGPLFPSPRCPLQSWSLTARTCQ